MLKVLPKATGYYKQLRWRKLKVSVAVAAALSYISMYTFRAFDWLILLKRREEPVVARLQSLPLRKICE